AGSVPEPGQQQRPHSSGDCISSRIAPIHYRPQPPMSSNHSPDQRVQRADVLVIGGGAAGLSLALRLADHARVVVLSKSSLRQGSTYYAQGGIAAVLDAADSLEAHVEDTLVAGAGLCHRDIVEYTVSRGRECIHWLLDQGVAFTRDSRTQATEGFHL